MIISYCLSSPLSLSHVHTHIHIHTNSQRERWGGGEEEERKNPATTLPSFFLFTYTTDRFLATLLLAHCLRSVIITSYGWTKHGAGCKSSNMKKFEIKTLRKYILRQARYKRASLNCYTVDCKNLA